MSEVIMMFTMCDQNASGYESKYGINERLDLKHECHRQRMELFLIEIIEITVLLF